MKNNNIKIYFLFAFLVFASSCDNQELVELNINPNASNDIDLTFLLARGTLRMTNDSGMEVRANFIYGSNFIQHNADATSGFQQGDKYFYNAGYSGAMWDAYYGDAVKQLTNVVDNTKDDPARINLYAMALAERAFILHRLSDMYGDIPYTQAGRGLDGQANWFPTYNTQEEVYGFVVDDLREARSLLTAGSNNIGVQDLIYGGDTVAWKKFINSLLIRVGMRLTKVDAGLAQSIVEEAVNHPDGIMQSNDDNAIILHTADLSDNTNGRARPLRESETYAFDLRPSATFIDWMIDGNDPRLAIISGGTGNALDETTWDVDTHIGLPNGLNETTSSEFAVDEGIIPNAEGYSKDIFSFINPKLYNLDDPAYLLAYSEVAFNLAEAKIMGWNVPGSSTENFEAGVTAAIDRWVAFDASLEVPAATTQAYISSLGFGAATNQLELIGEQYWASQYFDHLEAWYNYRRTGFPALTPVNFAGNITGGTIPRRFQYPEAEIGNNPDNYKAAVASQGQDLFTTRVWWDVE